MTTPERDVYQAALKEVTDKCLFLEIELGEGGKDFYMSYMDVCSALSLDPWQVGTVVYPDIYEVYVLTKNDNKILTPVVSQKTFLKMCGSFLTPVTKNLQTLWMYAKKSEEILSESTDENFLNGMLGL